MASIFTPLSNWARSNGLISGPTRDLGKSDPETAIVKLVKVAVDRTKKDIENWRNAIEYAENTTNPRRWELIYVFKDIERDAHLTAVMQTRKLKVLGQKWKMCDVRTGDYLEQQTTIMQGKWFRQYIDLTLDAQFYGYSPIEFPAPKGFGFDFLQLIPREHCSPEQGLILPNPSDMTGLNVKDKPWKYWVQIIGEPDDLGLLMKAAPYVLYKRNAISAWNDFCEIFGMPIRTATTTTRDKGELRKIEYFMKEMGRAAYGIFPEGTEIEMHESKHSDAYQVFLEQVNLHNREMSKLILGQTGTTEEKSFAGTAVVHQSISNEYMEADLALVADQVNDVLIPYLIDVHGFPLQNCKLVWDREESLSSKDKAEIISKLVATGYRPTQEELENTFGWELEPTGQPSTEEQVLQAQQQIQALYKE